jgi:hypothetical protein
VGRAVAFSDQPEGLVGTFQIREGQLGDECLNDLREGYLPAMSVGFKPMKVRRGANGETEVVEGMLKEVSLLPVGAYEGARVLSLRQISAGTMSPPPAVDLSPAMPGWAYRSASLSAPPAPRPVRLVYPAGELRTKRRPYIAPGR